MFIGLRWRMQTPQSSLLGCLADHDDLHQRVHMRRLSLEATRKSRC
jgi:hypothetical protein